MAQGLPALGPGPPCRGGRRRVPGLSPWPVSIRGRAGRRLHKRWTGGAHG